MQTVVLDTNVLVSAMLGERGNESRALRLALSAGFEIGVSREILSEYREVLARPRFRISRGRIDALFSQLEKQATLVHPICRLNVSPDESDNRFLECAQTMQAEFLITGNKRHFPANWQGTRVVNAREFLEQVVPL